MNGLKCSRKPNNQLKIVNIDQRVSCCVSKWTCWLNRRLTVQEIVKECNISFGSCEEILTKKLEVSHVVPWPVTEDKKQHRVEACGALLERTNNDDTHSLRASQQETKRGFTHITWRVKPSHHNGKAEALRGPRTHVSQDRISKSCWLFSLTAWYCHHKFLPQG